MLSNDQPVEFSIPDTLPGILSLFRGLQAAFQKAKAHAWTNQDGYWNRDGITATLRRGPGHARYYILGGYVPHKQ